MVLSLFGGEAGYGGEDTESIASEHDDVGGLTVGDTWDLRVGDVLDRVGTTGVLGDGDVVVIGYTVGGVVDDVLEDRTEFDGTVDLGFLLGTEVDALGVASTLNVEDTGVGPDVLVVADQQSVGVGGESGLAGTGKTEEKSDVPLALG